MFSKRIFIWKLTDICLKCMLQRPMILLLILISLTVSTDEYLITILSFCQISQICTRQNAILWNDWNNSHWYIIHLKPQDIAKLSNKVQVIGNVLWLFMIQNMFLLISPIIINGRQDIVFVGLRLVQLNCYLTHWGWVMHICVSKLGHHWFR